MSGTTSAFALCEECGKRIAPGDVSWSMNGSTYCSYGCTIPHARNFYRSMYGEDLPGMAGFTKDLPTISVTCADRPSDT